MEWYKCRPRKLLDACEGLGSAALVSTYRTILDRIYECDGPVHNDPSSIGRYAGLRPSHAAKAIADLIHLGKLFQTADGKLFNQFASGELGDRAELSQKRSEAGGKGGRESGRIRSQGGANGDQGGRNGDQSGKNLKRDGKETGENSQSAQAIASTRAQEKRREDKSLPPTPRGHDRDGDGQKPAGPLTAEDRARLRREVADVAERPDLDADAVQRVTGEIMRRAKMTAPPVDLVLVDGWLANGIPEDLILETVTRLSANAKGTIRAFRYFSAEIKRQHEARGSSEDAAVAEFERIRRRAQAP